MSKIIVKGNQIAASIYHKFHLLQIFQGAMRDPERTLVCDILANGQLLPDPTGERHGIIVEKSQGLNGNIFTWRPNDDEYVLTISDGSKDLAVEVIYWFPVTAKDPPVGQKVFGYWSPEVGGFPKGITDKTLIHKIEYGNNYSWFKNGYWLSIPEPTFWRPLPNPGKKNTER